MSGRAIILGFFAGAISVLVFHQAMVLGLHMLGFIPNPPWNLSTMRGPLPIPILVNQMFWGGLWGIVFALVGGFIPLAQAWLRGAVFGLLGPYFLGNALLVPFFKGGAYFWGWNPSRMWIGALIGAAFGAGLGLILPRLAKR